jgi:hypothetical protein
MAEKYWGRFKTIQISIFIALVGHVILIISAIPPVIVHPEGAIAAFSIGLVVMGLGVGGFKSNISVLIAEQRKSSPLGSDNSTRTNFSRNRERDAHRDHKEGRKSHYGSRRDCISYLPVLLHVHQPWIPHWIHCYGLGREICRLLVIFPIAHTHAL